MSSEVHEAAELGDLEKVRAYLEKDPKQINATDSKGRTVLGRAARSGKKELVLNAGADPNLEDKENIPLLHQAIIRAIGFFSRTSPRKSRRSR